MDVCAEMCGFESILVNSITNYINFYTLALIRMLKRLKSNRQESNELGSKSGPSDGLYDTVDLLLDAGVVSFAIDHVKPVQMELSIYGSIVSVKVLFKTFFLKT